MDNNKLLSVIVPSYNMEAYLAKNVTSMMVADKALRQRVEVIVVNDGSKDRTSEIAHGLAEKYPGCVTVIDKPNGHYGSCINAALPVAKGKYIRVLDADDYANTEAFEHLLAYLVQIGTDNNELDLIISDFCHVDSEGNILWRGHYDFPKERGFPIERLIGSLTPAAGLHAITYRTEILREIEYLQTEGCAYTDMEWATIPMANVRTAGYLDEFVVYYLVGRDGQTMQPEIYFRDFPIVMRLALGNLKKYIALSEKFTETRCRYLRDLMRRQFNSIYQYCILSVKRHSLLPRLQQFDEDVKRFDAEMYEDLLNNYIEIFGFRFFYIKQWRQRGGITHLKIRLWIFLIKCYYCMNKPKDCLRRVRNAFLKKLHVKV